MPTPEQRDRYLRKTYGLSLAQYNEMLRLQGGVCYICRRPRKVDARPLNVDHDHRTGRVRGLLCFTCNHHMLARGCDKYEFHVRAALYLARDFDGRTLAIERSMRHHASRA